MRLVSKSAQSNICGCRLQAGSTVNSETHTSPFVHTSGTHHAAIVPLFDTQTPRPLPLPSLCLISSSFVYDLNV